MFMVLPQEEYKYIYEDKYIYKLPLYKKNINIFMVQLNIFMVLNSLP